MKIRLLLVAIIMAFLGTSCVGKIEDLEYELDVSQYENTQLMKDNADLSKEIQKLTEEVSGPYNDSSGARVEGIVSDGDGSSSESLTQGEENLEEDVTSLEASNQEESSAAAIDILGPEEAFMLEKEPRVLSDLADVYDLPQEGSKYYDLEVDEWMEDTIMEGILFFDVLSHGSYKSYSLSENRLLDQLSNNQDYYAGVEKSSQEVYLFYDDDRQTCIDVYRLVYDKVFEEASSDWVYVRNIKLGMKVEEVHRMMNGLVYIYHEGDQRLLKIMDRDLQEIESFVIDEGFQLYQLRYIVRRGELRYLFECSYEGSDQWLGCDVSYLYYEGNHFVDTSGSDAFYNGVGLEGFYGDPIEGDKHKIVYRNMVFDYSNHNTISRIKMLKRPIQVDFNDMVIGGVYGDLFLFTNDKGHVVYAEKADESLAPEHELMDMSILDNKMAASEDGYYYIDGKSLNLVQLDREFNEISRMIFPDQDIEDMVKSYWSNGLNWSILDETLIIIVDSDMFTCKLKTQECEWVNLGLQGVQIEKDGLYYYTYDNVYQYNFDLGLFEVDYPMPEYDEYNFYFGGNFMIGGIAYYNDHKEVSYGASDEILAREDILPASQAPDILWKGVPVLINDSIEVEGVDYLRLKDSLRIGRIENQEFIPITENAVREVETDGHVMVYTGYGQEDHMIYLYDGVSTYEVEMETCIDHLTVYGQEVWFVTGGRFLNHISLDNIINKSYIEISTGLDLVSEDDNYLAQYYYDFRNFDLVCNQDYILAYERNKIVVLDHDMNIVERLNADFLHLTQDNRIITDTLLYTARHDIKTGQDTILGINYFADNDLVQGDAIITNVPYEGPSITKLIHINGHEIYPFKEYKGWEEDLDYTIEIGRGHQTYLIIYDHKEKKLHLIDIIGFNIEYELKEDGLYYEDTYSHEIRFYPLRPDAKIQIYSAKRT